MTPDVPESLDDKRQRVRQSFDNQAVMRTLGAILSRIGPGEIEIRCPFDPKLSQQHGFLHAGIVSTLMDSACGYAAFSMMPVGAEVLSIEFKTNLLAPASGDSFRMLGKLRKAGRNVFFTEAEAYAISEGREKLVATMSCTLMALQGRRDLTARGRQDGDNGGG